MLELNIQSKNVQSKMSEKVIIDICNLQSSEFIKNFLNFDYKNLKISTIKNGNSRIFGLSILEVEDNTEKDIIIFKFSNKDSYHKQDILLDHFYINNSIFNSEEIAKLANIISNCDNNLLHENLVLLNMISSLK